VVSEAEEDCEFIGKSGWRIEQPLDDGMFRQAFDAADFAWCAYWPSRDMSSGILGRCVQSSTVPIVRQGSVAEQLASEWSDPVSVDFADNRASARAIAAHSGQAPPVPHDRLKSEGYRARDLIRQFLAGERHI
jgi:hypothetical protein